MSSEIRQVPVKILGKEFVVACPAEQEHELVESARVLDRRMREIRDSGKVIGTERIAVMAALNLAHELVQKGGEARSALSPEATERLRALQERIDAVLDEEDRQFRL